MSCLNSSLSEDGVIEGAVAGVGVGARDTMEIGIRVPLPLIGAAPASSSSPTGQGFP